MNEKRQTRVWMGVAIFIAVVALVFAVIGLAIPMEEPVARSYNTACYRELGGDKWTCASGGEFEIRSGATLDVQSGASVNLPDLTIAGAPEITGTLTADDVVVTDTLTVGGAATINDAAEITGALTVASASVTGTVSAEQLTSTDDVTVTDDLNVGGDATITGRVLYDVYVTLATTNTTVSATDSGKLYANKGATTEITLTLPSAAAGIYNCIYVSDAYTVTIAPATGDTIEALTNAAGDRLQNTGTSGDSICLVGLDIDEWAPLQEVGTWSDIN